MITNVITMINKYNPNYYRKRFLMIIKYNHIYHEHKKCCDTIWRLQNQVIIDHQQ